MVVKIYESQFSLTPRIAPKWGKVFRVQGFITEGLSEKELKGVGKFLKELYQNFPHTPATFVVISRGEDVHLPSKGEGKKKEFLKRYEEFLRRVVNTRSVKTYFIWNGQEKDLRDLLLLFEREGVKFIEGRKALMQDLSYFFGGTPEDPFWNPIEEWDWGVKVGDKYGAVLVNTSPPVETQPLHFDFLLRIPEDFIFVLSFKKLLPSEVQMELETKIHLFEKQERESKQDLARELREVVKLLEKGEEGITEYSAVLTLFKEDAKSAYESAKSYEFYLKRQGLDFTIEGTSEFDAFKSLFDWNYKRLKDLGWVRRMLSSAFSYMLPLSSLPEGAKEGALFFTSGLTPFYLDLYHVPPPNATVLGQMGAGKSVFLQYLALFQDYVVFLEKIHESEGSYTVFTKAFGGNYYPISMDRPVSVAPFGDTIYTVDVVKFIEDLGYRYDDFSEQEFNTLRNIFNGYFFTRKKVKKGELIEKLLLHGAQALAYFVEKKDWEEWEVSFDIDRDKLVFLKTILLMMIRLGSSLEVDPALIEDIILETYRRVSEGKVKADREVLMRDFFETAKGRGEEEIAQRFKSYTIEGAYGHFFDRPCDVSLAPYVFFELRTSDKEILPLIVISILTNIVKWFSRPEMGDKRKGVILDEAWFFTGDEFTMKFIEEALRTYRKKGIFIVLASQLAKDFGEGAGEVIKSTCPYNVFLYSDVTEHDNIARVFKMNETEKELLKTVKRPKDYNFQYSKFYMRTPYEVGGQKVKGVFHLIPSREFYWIATTHPQDKVKREEYRNKYKDLLKAIEMLALEDEKSEV